MSVTVINYPLILRKRQNIQNFVNTAFSVKKPNQQKIDLGRLNLLLDTTFRPGYGIEHNIRVISWIIYYGA
jgi:hypothetical protein